MRRGLFVSLAAVLLFSSALGLPATGHEGAEEAGKAGALSAQNRWMSNFMSAAAPESQNVERVGGDNSFTGSHLVIQGNRLYVGWYGKGFRIYNISRPASPRLIGTYNPPGPRADAVPDATTFSINDRVKHIAVLNGTRRVSSRTTPDGNQVIVEGTDISEFLDVTNPSNPKLLWKFVGQQDGEAHNGDISDKRKWWLPSGGTGDNGLRIYNMRPLLNSPPEAPRRLFPPNNCRNKIGVLCDPVTLWEKSPYRGNKPVGQNNCQQAALCPFTHTHDITIYENYPVRRSDGSFAKRDIILLAEGGDYAAGNDRGSVFVIDITDPRNPVVLFRWLHKKGSDHKPIRYHHEAQFLPGSRVMLVTDEDLHEGAGCAKNAGGSYAVRLSENLRSARELSEWFIPTGTPAPICSVHVFSTLGNVVFFGSYNAGLQVVDYTDRRNPKRIGQYIAEGTTAWGAQYYKGVIYVGDMTRGLDVFRFTGTLPRSSGGGGDSGGGSGGDGGGDGGGSGGDGGDDDDDDDDNGGDDDFIQLTRL